jgi:hypothetical protein
VIALHCSTCRAQSTVNLSSGVIVFLGPFLGFDFPLTLIQVMLSCVVVVL